MKKLYVAAGVAMAVAAGVFMMQKPDCGGHLDCISQVEPLVVSSEFETAMMVDGLPIQLTDIQLLSAPMDMDVRMPAPRAQLLLPVPAVMQEGIMQGLQGGWYSASDVQDRFFIDGSTRTTAYSGSMRVAERISVSGRCGSFSGGGSYLRAQSDGGEELCYGIESITGGDLLLTYMPTGETLHFRRLQ